MPPSFSLKRTFNFKIGVRRRKRIYQRGMKMSMSIVRPTPRTYAATLQSDSESRTVLLGLASGSSSGVEGAKGMSDGKGPESVGRVQCCVCGGG